MVVARRDCTRFIIGPGEYITCDDHSVSVLRSRCGKALDNEV